MKMNQSKWLVAAGVSLALSVAGHAQIKTIPKEGLPGLSKEAVQFEIEHNYRRENNLGQTVPAEAGTPPNSPDPHVLEGVWVAGKTYTVNADGTYSEAGMMPPAGGMSAGGAPGAPPGGAAPQGAGGPPGAGGLGGPGGSQRRQSPSCRISLSFAMALPSQIIQTDKVMYIFHNSSMDGTNYRRIEMTASHPAKLEPMALGHSIGHWDGDTLIVETIGLKGSAGAAAAGPGPGGPPGGGGINLTATSKVTERIKKIEGGLKLEDLVTVEDSATNQVNKQRIVSYYRPDLQYVEAPCEEYSDPFADAYGDAKASAEEISKIINGESK
jgi:hypothetical protein